MNRLFKTLALTGITLFALSACVTIPADPIIIDPTPVPPIEEQHVVQIHLTSDMMNLLYEPQEIAESIPYATEVETVVNKLNESFGYEGTVTAIAADGTCVPESTVVNWGGFSISYINTDPSHFQVLVKNYPTDELPQNIKITTYENTQLGDTFETVSSKLVTDPEYIEYEDTQGVVNHFLVIDKSETSSLENPEGVIGWFTNNSLEQIFTPAHLYDNC